MPVAAIANARARNPTTESAKKHTIGQLIKLRDNAFKDIHYPREHERKRQLQYALEQNRFYGEQIILFIQLQMNNHLRNDKRYI